MGGFGNPPEQGWEWGLIHIIPRNLAQAAPTRR